MHSFASIRPRLAEWRGWLPPLALPLFMFIALIALGGDRGFLYRAEGDHDWGTVKNLAIAENLSPEHNFLLTLRVWRDDEDGGLRYVLYSRFPVGGYALMKLAMLPFGDDLANKMMAARVLMLMMFCGAAAFGYLAMSRITGSRWIALSATPLAFSGFYALYYADYVSGESVMDMFGVGLAFHGMVVFIQEGRFRQLLVKTCAALLLGWHVYALLLPFIFLGFGGEAVAVARAAIASNEKVRAARAAIIALVRSRYAVLAAVSILFGSTLLAFNLANEYMAERGRVKTLSELPSVESALKRLGVTRRAPNPALEWDNFTRRQLYRAGVASVPYAAARAVGWEFRGWEPLDVDLAPTVWGLAAAGAALASLALARGRRLLMATAILFGFCWAAIARPNVFEQGHTYEAVHYVWLALALFALALMGARRLLGGRLGGGVAIAAAATAAPIFALSVFYAGQTTEGAYEAERQRAEMEDFEAILETTRRESVKLFMIHGARFVPWDYYLAGSYWSVPEDVCDPRAADFMVSGFRAEIPNLRSPENRFVFLYEDLSPLELCRAARRRLESEEPAARAVFDVYLQDGAISYLKAPCEARDYEAPFYIYVHPVNPDDLPPRFDENGFYSISGPRDWERRILSFDGACFMTIALPSYPTSAIQTGQWIPGVERLWEVFVNPPPNEEALAHYESAYQAIAASGEPAARSGFDLYLDRDHDTLSYLKAPCGEDDARGRFFLSVHPVNVEDLPADRREVGHESLNFTFAPPAGVVFDGKCMATRRLPDYDIAIIETGQWVPGGERVWAAEIAVGD